MLPIIRRLPAYTRLAWAIIRDERVGKRQKAIVLGGLGYLVSPIDLIPGFIPIIGQLDDFTIALWALRSALRRLSTDLAAEHLEAQGLSWEILDADLARTRRAGGLIARTALHFGLRFASLVGSALVGLGRRLLQPRS
ncbi:MAG: YkvA family protein [Gammaproteobacteria bacterium]